MYGKLSGVSWLLQFGRTILWSVRGKRALREGRPVAYERQLFRRAMEWILVILLEVGVIALFACVGMPKAGLVLAGSLLVLLAFAAVVLWFRPSRETNWWVRRRRSYTCILDDYGSHCGSLYRKRAC